MSTPREILLVTPSLFDRGGGIARIARATSLACHQVCTERGWRLMVFSLLDKGEARDERYLPSGAGYLAFDGNRLALTRALLRRVFDSSHVGSIFCHVNLAGLGLLYPPRLPGRFRPYVVVAHGVDVWCPLPAHRRYALRWAREVWPVSNFTARKLSDVQGVQPDRIRTMYNCLDPFWAMASERGSAKEGRYVLCVSRLARSERYKGVDELVRAFVLAERRLGGMRLVVVGDGDDGTRLHALAARSIASGQISFRGAVDDAELQRLYAGCEAFAMPSRSEGFGLVFLEAMAHGKPVLAAASTATPEVVLHSETGLLVPYGNVEKVAEALIHLSDDPARARAMGERGLERVRQRFSYERYLGDIRSAMSQLWGTAIETTLPETGTK